jgi:tetratricopeptide (TPR) repeat protein
MGRTEEAITCGDKVLELDPHHAMAWYGKALDLEAFGRKADAAESYRRFVELGPAEYPEQLAYAQQRFVELGGKPATPRKEPRSHKSQHSHRRQSESSSR